MSWLLKGVFLFVCLSGCEIAPDFVESSHDVDRFLLRENFKSACVALEMKKDDDLRRYTAMVMLEYPNDETVNSCLCDALYTPGSGSFDLAVVNGIQSSRRDDLAQCLARGLSDQGIENRKEMVHSLGRISAKASYETLATLVKDEADVAVRIAAVESLRPSAKHVPLLLEVLQQDAEPQVRAAAARAMKGRKNPDFIEHVTRLATEDPSGIVRAASLAAVVKLKLPVTDAMVCKAMIDDPEPVVRVAAVKAYHGTKRTSAIECLRKRLLKEELAPEVRAATLKALGASPSKHAARALCDGIAPFMWMYVREEIAEKLEGVNIVETQNNRDYEKSYACVNSALRQGGFSCYAQNHLGHWFNELGGSASTPWCPGMIKNAVGGEVVF